MRCWWGGRRQHAARFHETIRPSSQREAYQARKSNAEVVQGTWNALPALLKDMGVDHGRGKIVVPEQLLNGADVGAALEQVSGKGVAKCMGADVLRQTGTADRYLDGLVDDAGINMVTACDTGTRVYGEVPGGEDILPGPLLGGMGILPIQRMGQVDLTVPMS
jgi:phytoene/squalene synthetase